MARGGTSKADILKRVPLFAECSKSDLARIGRIADEVDLRAGKELIREGDLGRQFFVLLDGSADVRRKGRKIAALGRGDFFGEIALVTDRETTASVTTTSPARVLVITRAAFRGLLRDHPGVQLKVLSALARRIPGD
ncbi:MAG: cyclic nucleotide-binding domain-containing protein [Gaiellaceae bacterium]